MQPIVSKKVVCSPIPGGTLETTISTSTRFIPDPYEAVILDGPYQGKVVRWQHDNQIVAYLGNPKPVWIDSFTVGDDRVAFLELLYRRSKLIVGDRIIPVYNLTEHSFKAYVEFTINNR